MELLNKVLNSFNKIANAFKIFLLDFLEFFSDLYISFLDLWNSQHFLIFFSTSIGAASGALVAFVLQNSKEKKAIFEKNKGFINYSLVCIMANLEELLVFKKQAIIPMLKKREEVFAIEGMENYCRTGQSQPGLMIPNLDPIMEDQSEIEPLLFPHLEKMANLAKDHPDFLRLAHRSIHHFNLTNETIRKFNNHIHKISEKDHRISAHEISFLLSLVFKLNSETDNALFFLNKTKRVIYKICDSKFSEKRDGFYQIIIIKEYIDLMPSEDYLKGYESI